MPVTSAEQAELLTTLDDVANMIQKAQTNIKKCPKQRLTEGYVKARRKTLEDYWDTFKTTHNDLIRCTSREQRGELPYFLNEDFYKTEDIYLYLHADLTDLLTKLESQRKTDQNMEASVTSQDSQLSFTKLPRIELKTFSGRYEDWPAYQDLFVALVHNTNLSNVQKLHYLKTSVSGEAEALLRHVQIIDCNYVQAWELLKGRFGNKKMIVTSLMKRLFGQKKVNNQSANQIKALLDTTTECLNSLRNLHINTDSWDPIIVFLVTQKLDTESLKDWEEHGYKESNDELPKWNELVKFLESKFRTLELIAPASSDSRSKPSTCKSFHVADHQENEEIFQSAHASTSSEVKQISCVYCKGSHYIFNCKDFGKQTVEQRQDFVKRNNLCFNCLKPNHSVYRCKQRTTCRICRRRHHSLLHQVTNQEIARPPQAPTQPEQPQTAQIAQTEQKITTAHFSNEQSSTNSHGHEVLLATAQVEVTASNGVTYTLRALIDQGSEASFVSAKLVDLLGLTRTNIKGLVSGVGEGTKIPIKHLVDLSVKSRFSSKGITVRAYVLKTISNRLPLKQVTINWPQLKSIQLADSTYATPGKIDMLLGAEVFCKIIEDGLVKIPNGLVAQKTSLGWILSGQKKGDKIGEEHNFITLHITRMVDEDNDLLRKFWEIETDLYRNRKLLTKEEEKCEEIYRNTTQREETGRYVVRLPLKQSKEETIILCGETKQQAIARFKSLEKKFTKNENLKKEYAKVIEEYMKMGHMKRSKDDNDKSSIYLPHHAVIREDKDTTKVRVVFDASAKGSNGHSLNDTMMIGPVIQPDLRSLIITWRKHRICVVGDIVKMYRMIKMAEEHTDLHCIIWRNNPSEEFESYNLTTVTFGTAAAPFLAVRTLSQLADDESHEYPLAAQIIKTSFYMDDLMFGEDSEEEIKRICQEIKEILRRGGFEMQKWSSNSDEVLESLRDENNTKDIIEIKIDKVIRILGLTWDRKEDTFEITVNLPELRFPITKRSVLSDVARLFDPFGWLSPVVIVAKVLIQKLWIRNLQWDEHLPNDLCNEWKQYRNELLHLKNLTIPRWLKTTPENYKETELHGFADASTQAYAAVTYLRVVENDTIHVTIIASRTKVAPVKQISVPKLELSAAALLAELINDLADLLHIPKDKIYAWTDSTVVLSWLQSHSSRWQTFVANRVADITRVIDSNQWRHVQSAENPADIATRGVQASDIANHEIWWTGPRWLREKELPKNEYEVPQTDLELKVTHAVTEEQPIWERFSTISRMKRVLAYCKRFKRKKSESSYLTVKEMEDILEECIRYYQNLVYKQEIEELKNNKHVSKKSCLITLSPFLDEKGLIRVGGRLQHASIPSTTKNPIIIPNSQHITKLIVNEAHARTLHGGIQLMMAYIRTKYWVIGLKSAVRKCIHHCKVCIVDKAKVRHQFMGQLPAPRVNPHRAFINSGVDYAGPMWIRTSKGRGHHAYKGYVCLFVCMSTRAIHLEAVTDLTSQAFIAAFRRFVARRGHCSNLFSDNGTNFIGAAKELKELFQAGKDNMAKEIAELLANDGTSWHFIPPKMPNCGGLWEAGVQSAKRHLTRINKNTKLTYEEMATLLAQIEACLNSRPLCKMDNNTDTPLTPGHFLVGEPLIGVPDQNYEDKRIGLLDRWQLIQKMTQDFWYRWRTEYLHTLQQRYKWQIAVPAPVIGDIVIIKDEDTPPTKWLLGKVKHIHPGADNLVRVVTVQCKGNHELKRPLSKLILLPKEPENE